MKIKAAVSRRGADTPVLEDVELEGPRAGEILVRLAACGICPTDLKAHQGIARAPKPIVLGHEGAGIVERAGDGVADFAPGDRVVLTVSSCGLCPNCRHDLPSHCDDTMRLNFGGLRADGSSPLSAGGVRLFGHFFGQSSFAQYAIVDARAAVKIPADMPFEHAAPLACGMLTGAGAVFSALQARADQTIAVFGVGAVGLAGVMAARIAGMQRIIAIDRRPERLALAGTLGASDVIDSSKQQTAAAIRALVPRGVDLCLNTTADGTVFSAALECLAVGGVAGFVAAPGEEWKAPLPEILRKGVTLKAILGGDVAPRKMIPDLIAQYRTGAFPIANLVTLYRFEDIARAFSDLENGRAIKPVLMF
jgi:aryl-alcohol dehydrogenase